MCDSASSSIPRVNAGLRASFGPGCMPSIQNIPRSWFQAVERLRKPITVVLLVVYLIGTIFIIYLHYSPQ
jgi:hypothetical protein